MSDVEIVEVTGWEGTLLGFSIWRKTYLHIWEHITTSQTRRYREQLRLLNAALGCEGL